MSRERTGHLPDSDGARVAPAETAHGRIRALCEFRDQITTRTLFVAWRILEIMEQRVVPAAEIADRVSAVLGRDVTADDWWEWLAWGVGDSDVNRALARVLHADPDWLADGMVSCP